MSSRERELLIEAFDSNWIAPLGPHVDAFEKEFCQAVDVPHAAALSSGTAALHLALQLLDVGPGDTVACSDLTFASTVNAIRYLGATPVLIDADAATWNLDPVLLRQELESAQAGGKPTKAVITVDLYGQSADYDPILAACEEFDVPVVEDAAEALGATYRGRPVGGFGRFGIFSFNGNKIITTSGGGMLVSQDGEAIGRARFLATQARDPAPHYEHSVVGYNYRLSNLLAAVGSGQLEVLGQRVEARRAVFDAYRQALGDLPGLEFMPEAPYGKSTRWLTCLTITPEEFGADREAVRLALEAEDIEARPVWKPMHLQPVFAQCRVRGGKVGADLFSRGLCLPSGSALRGAEIERIATIIRRCHRP
jgi:pyridoxal phosphate-dependent aminotransferase EpsN